MNRSEIDNSRPITATVTPPIPVDGPGAADLALTDIVSVATLQELQDSFIVLTNIPAVIRDADGQPITQQTDVESRQQSDDTLNFLIGGDGDSPGATPLVAPIMVNGQTLGTISIEEPSSDDSRRHIEPSRARRMLENRLTQLGVDEAEMNILLELARDASTANRAAGVQFLDLLANNIARLCYQEYALRRRLEELSLLYNLSTQLTGQRDLQKVLNFAAKAASDALQTKAASIRLLDPDTSELRLRAGHGLSEEYLQKGPIRLVSAQVMQDALSGQPVYVEDMANDSRVIYPDEAQKEGLVSMLCAGMVYQGKQIGVVQVFSDQIRRFSQFEHDLLRAVAQLLAGAIENARLAEQQMEAMRVQRQLQVASSVQQRMLPSKVPSLPGLELSARFVPCFELAGDFYDFIELNKAIGLVIGDVVGKGLAASLLMASVRASLRAYTQDVYDLDEIISRVNDNLVRDTLDNEFATLWYGTIDLQTRRLTYCNAGQEAPLLLRGDEIIPLDVGGMLIGVSPGEAYQKSVIDLKPHDRLVLYTDGLTDAMNFEGNKFGKQRLIQAMRSAPEPTAKSMLNHVLWEMRRFVGLKEAIDDVTIVTLRVNESQLMVDGAGI